MSGDYSRQRFDPHADFGAVLMQQGRVQLDADWNEWAEILDRRFRAETADLTSFEPDPDVRGVSWYPRLTPDAFQVTVDGGSLAIGRGRMYVDGLLVENHGSGEPEYDSVLGEERGRDPVGYEAQPYHPTPPELPGSGRVLVYLDAWQREVGAVESPDLVEVAVGVDTTRRLQTVWQVRFLGDVAASVECDTPDAAIEGWGELIRPSGGRLSTRAIGIAPVIDPCELPPGGGFRGLENQLYRVEIHDGGAPGTATFKWSRDNATVEMGVVEVLSAHELRLDTLGRDDVLRLNSGDWVEILDDRRELSGEDGDPARRRGEMRQITVNDEQRTITFSPDLTDLVPSGAGADTAAARHLRVRRWDQARKVFDADGDEYFDLEGSDGVIPVPLSGTTLHLEAGVVVTFGLAADGMPGGAFRAGDYWTFAARTATGSVEELEAAPPRGPQHHFARLAIVDLPSTVVDCRRAWPPEATGGHACGCTVCVSAEEFADRPERLQEAVDQLRAAGGSICLGAGEFVLRRAVRIEDAKAITIRGQGAATQLIAPGAAFEIETAADIAIESLGVLTLGRSDEPIVLASQVLGLRLERVHLRKKGGAISPPVISLSRVIARLEMRGCTVEAPRGVAMGPARGGAYLSLQGATIEDNELVTRFGAIDLDGDVLHGGLTRISGNTIRSGGTAVRVTGATVDISGVTIAGNVLQCTGDGIVAGVSGVRIEGNEISHLERVRDPAGRGREGRGIAMVRGFADAALQRTLVFGNRVVGLGGAGIAVEAQLETCLVKNNVIEDCGEGIVFFGKASADAIAIENNHVLDLASDLNEEGSIVAGIRVLASRRADVSGNVVRRVGVGNVQGQLRAGIVVAGCESVRVVANEVTHIGPPDDFLGAAAAIMVIRPYDNATIAANVIERVVRSDLGRADWIGVMVGAPPAQNHVRLGGDAVSVSVGEDRSMLLGGGLGTGEWISILPLITFEFVAVEGNKILAASSSPGIHLAVWGEARVNDNHCIRRGGVAIDLAARSAVVSGNRATGDPALRVSTFEGRLVLVGNVAEGGIDVAQGMQPPWEALNLIS